MIFRIICTLSLAVMPAFAYAVENGAMPADEGIRFSCPSGRLEGIQSAMSAYLGSLGIPPDQVAVRLDRGNGVAAYTLNTPPGDTSTLDLRLRPELQIHDAIVNLPGRRGKAVRRVTVSKKEILLALLQHGRLTEFRDGACDIHALKEHIALRQSIVAWAENLNWVWPNGNAAEWNEKYWVRGTPKAAVPLHEAVADAFVNQRRYAIGCYTASKLVIVQGVLDYFRRIDKQPERLRQLERRLRVDGEPLAHIEPGKMWSFEQDFDLRQLDRPGKLLKIEYGVAPKNFVPGDWIHLQNTDVASYQKTGYEGSNPIYLGRNKFVDYFNDNRHAYSYREKLDEVYQWRNGVFSRSRDAAKIKPLSIEDVERLGRPPAQGGVVTDMRVFPYFFGYEALPALGDE